MEWLRSLAAEIFPAWHRRRLRRAAERQNLDAGDALARYRRRVAGDAPQNGSAKVAVGASGQPGSRPGAKPERLDGK